MVTKLVLHAKTRKLDITARPDSQLKICTQKPGHLVMTGGEAALAAALLQKHNLNPHAHPNLWYIHEQAEAADVWHVEHNLKRYPSVTVVDSGDNVVIGYITYLNDNALEIKFNGAFKGKAYLN